MGYDDFDSGDDDLSVMLTMDEMDAEGRRIDAEGYHGGGCLTSILLLIATPAAIIWSILSLFR